MTRVKICGITNLDDALAAVEAGADLLGFVFFPQSPRYVEPERAREITAALKECKKVPRLVGVFVNEALERVHEIVATAQLDIAQLHGDESPEMVRALAASRISVVKALRPGDAAEAGSLVARHRSTAGRNAPAFIVDAFDARRYGGTGVRADWQIAAHIAREFPILLAGGLNADNVAEALRAVRPWGVDVSSSVERAPGLKDHTQVRQFIQAAKDARPVTDDR